MIRVVTKYGKWCLHQVVEVSDLQMALYSLKNGISAVSEPDAKESYANPYIGFLKDSYYHWWF